MRGAPLTVDRQHVLAEILFQLVQRQRPTPTELRRVTGWGDRVDEALADLVRSGAVVADGDGMVIAAYPLSAVPTRHVVELGPLRPWANCAIDALAVPMMVDRRGIVRSTCAHCGAPIGVDVDGAAIREVHPADAVVAYGRLTGCEDRPSLEVSCPFMNFFCNPEHFGEWERPQTWQGQAMPIAEALGRAVERFRPIIQIYTRYIQASGAKG